MAAGDNPSTSATLLRRLWDPDNDEEAWRTFLGRYGPLIQRWCRRLGLQHADADEIGARVLAKLATALRAFEYDPAQRFRGWLKAVVDNEVRNFWRELAHRAGGRGSGDSDVHDLLERAAAAPGVDGLVGELDEGLARDLEQAERVLAAVRRRVEPHTWQAFWLTAVEGVPAPEAAARLGLSVASVYMAKSRVGKLLRARAVALEGPNPEPPEGAR
jgi:RNA polymerase sigma-70 factor (ECF subfamily)